MEIVDEDVEDLGLASDIAELFRGKLGNQEVVG